MESDEVLRELVSRNYQMELSGNQPLQLFFQPVRSFYHQNFDALAMAAIHLEMNTNISCFQMVRTASGSFPLEVNGEQQILMAVPARRKTIPAPGIMLAQFHQETQIANLQFFPESPVSGNSIGLAGRMDRLAAKFSELESKSEHTPFERSFVANFTYFSGCAENALQYLVNLTIDLPEPEPLVFTHRSLQEENLLRPENPAGWVAEDRSRDLSDWLRTLALQEDAEESAWLSGQFLDEYESIIPLSRRTAASLFARLLFPQAYMECCERYLFSGTERPPERALEDLQQFEDRALEKERLLAVLALRYPWLPAPEWIAKDAAGPTE